MDILSKNATAEESIKKMNNALKSISSGITLGKQLHPLTNCYSVNLKSFDVSDSVDYVNSIVGSTIDNSLFSSINNVMQTGKNSIRNMEAGLQPCIETTELKPRFHESLSVLFHVST